MAKKKNSSELKTGSLLLRPISPEITLEKGEKWFAEWEIALKKEGSTIGTARFPLNAEEHSAELYVEIGSAYGGRGLGAEAAQELIDWAFDHDKVDFIEAEAEPENKAARHMLEEMGFEPDGENHCFLQEKNHSQIMIYMCIGLALGLAVGTSQGQGSAGMCIGLAVGVVIGLILDKQAQKKAAKKLEERKKRKNDK